MPTAKDLVEKRAGIWAQAQEFNERHQKGDTMSPEDDAAWTRALDEVDELGAEIDRLERTEKLDKRFAEIDDDTIVVDPNADPTKRGKDEYRDAFEKYLRRGLQDLEPEERKLLQANFDPDVGRAQGGDTGPGGGYTVPESFWAKVTETQKFFGGMLGIGEQVTTDSGNDLRWPSNDDTASEGEILGENTAVNEGDLAFGKNTLSAYTFNSKMVKVSLQLLQDTGIDLEGFLARRMAERIGRRKNRAYTTGSGVEEPEGIITGTTVGKTTASATAITYNEIVDLIHSVDVAYRATGRGRFELHDLVVAVVRKLRDDSGGAGLGRPLWEPSIQVGQPDSLLGYAVTVNNHMDSAVTATKKTMAFGDFQLAYVERSVNGGQVMRLAERFAEVLQVGFLGFERDDGLVQDSSAVKVLQQAP